MNYINRFNISSSTYLCTPILEASNGAGTYTYPGSIIPSIPSYISNASISSNFVFGGNIGYSAACRLSSSRSYSVTEGTTVKYYYEDNLPPSTIDFSVNNNFIVGGSLDVVAYETDSNIVYNTPSTGWTASSSIYGINSADVCNNIVVGCDTYTGYISGYSSYGINNNTLLLADAALYYGYSSNIIIMGGGPASTRTDVPTQPVVISPHDANTLGGTFIGGGTLTLNTSGNGTFLCGNNFHYSLIISLQDNGESSLIELDTVGFTVPNEDGTTEEPSVDEQGYYYTSIYDTANPAYRVKRCYAFDGYNDANGNPCSTIKSSYYCVKPTLYDIFLEFHSSIIDYGFWCGGIGYGTSSSIVGSSSMISPPYQQSKSVAFKEYYYCKYGTAVIGISTSDSMHFGLGRKAPLHYSTGPLIGFVERYRPWKWLGHYDYYSSVSSTDTYDDVTWSWVLSRSYLTYGYVIDSSFYYTELPKLVMRTDGTSSGSCVVYIHKVTIP